MNTFAPAERSETTCTNARSLAVNASCDTLLLGSSDGKVDVYSILERGITEELEVGSAQVTDTLWIGTKAVASTSTGNVKIFECGQEIASFSGHAGEATAVASHPSGDILASVGVDKSYIFYDLTSNTIASQTLTDSGKSETNAWKVYIPLTASSTHRCCLPSRWSFVRCWWR